MIGATRAIRAWAWPHPVDMRLGFDGLYGLVKNTLHRDPLTGDYFLFVNARRTKLPIVIIQHDLDEADRICVDCGDPLHRMRDQVEESDEISVVVTRHVIHRHQRLKYRCNCGHIDTAIGPIRLIPGGRYSPEFAVDVVVDKYADHLPLHRQAQRMRRVGLDVTRQTLWDQSQAVYHALLPTILALHTDILGSDRVHADETTWRVMRKGNTQKWWVWSVTSDRGVSPDRPESGYRRSTDPIRGLRWHCHGRWLCRLRCTGQGANPARGHPARAAARWLHGRRGST